MRPEYADFNEKDRDMWVRMTLNDRIGINLSLVSEELRWEKQQITSRDGLALGKKVEYLPEVKDRRNFISIYWRLIS